MAMLKADEETGNLPRGKRSGDARQSLAFAKILGTVGMWLNLVCILVTIVLIVTGHWPGGGGAGAPAPVPGVPQVAAPPSETPRPTTRPALTGDIAFRPEFTIGGRPATAGTAFVLRAPSGKLVALSAAHVLDPNEWNGLQSTAFLTMSGMRAVEVARPAELCRPSFRSAAGCR